MQSIYQPKLTEILPESLLNDSKIRAVAEALDVELEKLSAATREVLHLPRLEELSGRILDYLAEQFCCDFYEPLFLSDDEKKNLIRTSISWHRRKGTVAAVEEIAAAVWRSVGIEESKDYSAEPFKFRITTKGFKGTPDDFKTFLRMIDVAKNVRSHLEKIIVDYSDSLTPTFIKAGNAFGQIGYKGVELGKPSSALMKLHANTATFEFGLRGGIGLAKPILNHQQKLHAGQKFIRTGEITIGADMRDLNNRPESYRRLKETAIADILIVDIGIARPTGTNKESETEPDDDDYPFADGNWLRLYFDYPSGRDHPVLLINPRGDLIVNDIETVGDLAATNKIFLNSKAESTMGIHKADLIEGYVISNADDAKIIPSTGVLRIFFTFPTGNKRKILVHNLRGSVTIGDLKKLSEQVTEQRILLNAYNESSTGLTHAAAVKRFDIHKLDGDEPITF